MERWTKGCLNVFDILLKHPGTMVEKVVLVVLACVTCALVLSKVGKAMGFDRHGGGLAFLSSLIAGVLLILGLTVTHVFFPSAGSLYWVGAAAGVSLILVIPLISLIHKGNYVTSLITWLISAGAVVGVILLVSTGIDAAVSGSEKTGKARARKHQMEQLIGE